MRPPPINGLTDDGPLDPFTASVDMSVLELVNPTPGAARRAVMSIATQSDIGPERLAGLELSVSEIVTNAIVHGRSPVVVRAWSPSATCVVVTVRDAGPGPSRPVAIELPPVDAVGGGRGMWICSQSVDHLDMRVDADGFVVRLCVSH